MCNVFFSSQYQILNRWNYSYPDMASFHQLWGQSYLHYSSWEPFSNSSTVDVRFFTNIYPLLQYH